MHPFRAIAPLRESRPMNATEIAAALSTRAEDVCRRYLPRGRKQGRYWTSRRHKWRRGALALRAPGAPRYTRKMDRICCGVGYVAYSRLGAFPQTIDVF